MRAMILAAGRGERLKPLTDTCPKPLIKAGGIPLIEYHIKNLKMAGITEIVINLHYLGNLIEDYLGDGKAWGVSLIYSREQSVLEVGGGILQALPLLGEAPFIIVNGDIWTDYAFSLLPSDLKGLAYLVMVDNPQHNPKGDFALKPEATLEKGDDNTLTYSGISVLSPQLFEGCMPGRFKLAPLFDKAAKNHALHGEHFSGQWTDVGTIERLQCLEQFLAPSLERKVI